MPSSASAFCNSGDDRFVNHFRAIFRTELRGEHTTEDGQVPDWLDDAQNLQGKIRAYNRRYQWIQEARTEIEKQLLEVEVLTRKNLRPKFIELFEFQGEVFVAISQHLRRQDTERPIRMEPADIEKYENTLWAGHEQPSDSFKMKLDAKVLEIDGLIRPLMDPDLK
jgi:hypothetical protein